MSLWPDTVTIGGQTIALADVLAEVSIHHGRADVGDEPTATTCQLVLRDVDPGFVDSFEIGVELRVTAWDDVALASVPRFTGRVTDATLDVDDLTLIGTARLSTLTGYRIGTGNWPQETWSARMQRIFTEAGLASVLDFRPDPDFDPPLAARDPATAGETTLGDYLSFLAPMLGAAVVDGLDGSIVVQAIAARTLDELIVVEPADVAYAPPWTMALPGGNVVTVRYQGDQGASVTIRDEASVALYGERFSTLDTTFVNQADAQQRASTRLQRGAYARWQMLQAPILRGLPLELGRPLLLSQMPTASPFDPWTPILEGWEDTISGPNWTMQLALSDPTYSGVTTLAWQDVPATGYAWNQVNPETAWREALVLDTLTPP